MRRGLAIAASCLVAVASAPAEHDPELSEVVVTAPEPRYVAPTTRDRIGRVWVPVQMGGLGEYRMVLDTGAQRPAISERTAERLGLPLDPTRVIVHGTTGSAITPTITLPSLALGELQLRPSSIPVVADVFGGADGLLGTEGLQGHRIYIDFRHDQIDISRSRN